MDAETRAAEEREEFERRQAEGEARQRWEDSGLGVVEYVKSRIEEGDPAFDLDWETARELANAEAQAIEEVVPYEGDVPFSVRRGEGAGAAARAAATGQDTGIKMSVARVGEEGMKRSEAVAALNALKGGEFTNRSTGILARLSSTGAGKLISNAAVAKSIANGFTARQHNALAARIDALYENAILAEERPDLRGDVNIKSIRRFVCPVMFGKTEAGAYITVKESVEHGNRIYSVEGIKIAEKRIVRHDLFRLFRFHGDSISYPIRQCKGENEFLRKVSEQQQGERLRIGNRHGGRNGGAKRLRCSDAQIAQMLQPVSFARHEQN